LPLYLSVSFTFVINIRVKILKNYSRYQNEGKNYSRSNLKVNVLFVGFLALLQLTYTVPREGFSGEMWVCLNLNEVKPLYLLIFPQIHL